LGDVINNRESSKRIAKWGSELMDLNISVGYMAWGSFIALMPYPCLPTRPKMTWDEAHEG
jgi:hypothetical protein